MERILRQPANSSKNIDCDEPNTFLSIIPIILNKYSSDVPKIHEKLLGSIPQQSALFYNNCMYLGHWIAKNSDLGIPTHPALVKTLQSSGLNVFKAQEIQQQKILSQILKSLGKNINNH